MQKYSAVHLSYDEQLNKFVDRGMEIKDRALCLKKLESINYYKLKEFALPFYKNDKYENISLERVIRRFYQDKNLRMAFLYAIEKVEISFKNKVAFLLGENLGAFGYLEFRNWIDINKFPREYTLKKETEFKTKIKEKARKSFNPFVKEYIVNYDEEYLPIWLLIEALTFGDILDLYKLMTKKNKIKIANYYNCNISELESWLEHLKLIRNMSAHNSGVIDIKFKTIPKIRKEWQHLLYMCNNNYTNRIANTLVILKYLLSIINPEFHFGDIAKYFQRLTKGKDYYAHMYGLSSADMNFLFDNK